MAVPPLLEYFLKKRLLIYLDIFLVHEYDGTDSLSLLLFGFVLFRTK
jgi:hypothetical protein